MVINSYTPALSIYQQNTLNVNKLTQQIASGQKVNSAADNPAYLVILQGMMSQSNGYEQAYRNVEDTSSMLNVAEGAMGDTSSLMQDMRELSVQAANGTLTDQDRSFLQTQMDQLNSQINSNAANTNFNGIYTNNGSLSGFSTQLGPNSGDALSFSIGNMSSSSLGINTDISTQTAASNSLSSFDTAQDRLSSARSQIGAQSNTFEHISNNIIQSNENIQSAASTMGDTDMAQSISALNAARIKQYANIYAMKQNMGLQQSSLSVFA